MKTGILFLGHGTRDPSGRSEFMELISRVQDRVRYKLKTSDLCISEVPTTTFHHAFLEMCTPDLDTSLTAAYFARTMRIGIVPVFLFRAGHLKRDVPILLSSASEKFPGMEFTVHDATGEDERCVALCKTRILEAGFFQAAGTGLVMVARGSRDDDALQAFERVAKQVQRDLEFPQLEISFLTGPGQKLEDALQNLRARGLVNLCVVPYLLFSGTLVRNLRRDVEGWSRSYLDVSVKVASHLGVHELLVDSFSDKTLTMLTHISKAGVLH